ncbi:cystatin-F [Terrapene carolina triunguis]|uniref:Egg-white cystatin n=1 Tax=Terrapene triunguis TaxID=2587831 RepID=A0A674I7N0_9SAUR|nr:cystatin-F [Terrapene carolina triunguis]
MSFGWGLALFCYLSLWDLARTSNVLYLEKPNSTTRPGFPRPMNTNDPGVRRAARFGVYRYNNSSNDIFLFKESCITKAMVQVVRGLKYMLNVEIGRTVCDKRGHSNLDSCDFQKKKKLQQMFRCYFEVWTVPWLQRVQVLLALCH